MAQRKESVLDLGRFIDKVVRVKLAGGREVQGTLKGYDQLLNLVLDECVEFLQDGEDGTVSQEDTRKLGLIVARGTAVTLVAPEDGTVQIANPFIQQSEEI